MKMIDVGAKPKTERVATARGNITMAPETVARIVRGDVEKGDVLAACRIAGILAAKHTPDIVPLCHPIALSNIEVEATPGPAGVEVVATVKTVDRTGVEMEALAAVSAALLTIYDMLKRYEHGMSIERIELLVKDGGRTGLWLREKAGKPAAKAKAKRAKR